MIKGRYIITQDDERLVIPNIITTAGEKHILQYFAGRMQVFAESIGVGIINTTPTKADTKLGFQIEKFRISVASPDYTNGRIVYKTVIPASYELDIYEIGLWGVDPNFSNPSTNLFTFEPDIEPWSLGTYTATNSRVGPFSLSNAFTTTRTTTLSNLGLDLSRADVFYVAGSSTGTVTITMRFHTAATDYFQISASKAAGYNVTSIPNSPTVTGNPDWTNITSVDIIMAAASDTLYLDAVQYGSLDTLNQPVLISHAIVPSAPKVKLSSSQMDIEYELEVDIT